MKSPFDYYYLALYVKIAQTNEKKFAQANPLLKVILAISANVA